MGPKNIKIIYGHTNHPKKRVISYNYFTTGPRNQFLGFLSPFANRDNKRFISSEKSDVLPEEWSWGIWELTVRERVCIT